MPTLLGLKHRASDPALSLIAASPALNAPRPVAHIRKRRLNEIGRAQAFTQRRRDIQAMQGQRLFQPFPQGSRSRWVDSLQFPRQGLKRFFCLGVIKHGISRRHLAPKLGLAMFWQMLKDIALLVLPTTLNLGALAERPPNGRSQSATAVNDEQAAMLSNKSSLETLGQAEMGKIRKPQNKTCMIWRDFRAKIEKLFSPRRISVELLEDGSGVDWIKVHNENETFDLFDFHTKPSAMDIVSKALGLNVEDVEVDLEKTLAPHKESDRYFKGLIGEFNLPEDSVPKDWPKFPGGRGAFERWNIWFDGHRPVYLTIRPGKSKKR